MTESRDEQDNRHKALDAQWRSGQAMLTAMIALKNAIRILDDIDPLTEKELRHAEEIIADIRAQHPRKGPR